jgi:hypothetical protein
MPREEPLGARHTRVVYAQAGRDLGDSLRTRRARVQADDVGLPSGGHRRVTGLRREEVAEVPNAVGSRDAAFMLFSTSVIAPGRLDDIRLLHDRLHEGLRRWTTGRTLVNFLGIDDTTPELVRTAFEPADHVRLGQIKAAYDPDNQFRVNHNIRPAPDERLSSGEEDRGSR